jgi:hypothetical protein
MANLTNSLLNYSKEQSVPYETGGYSARQAIPRIFWQPEVSLLCSQKSVLSQLNPLYTIHAPILNLHLLYYSNLCLHFPNYTFHRVYL